jgi:hypothetical protein
MARELLARQHDGEQVAVWEAVRSEQAELDCAGAPAANPLKGPPKLAREVFVPNDRASQNEADQGAVAARALLGRAVVGPERDPDRVADLA